MLSFGLGVLGVFLPLDRLGRGGWVCRGSALWGCLVALQICLSFIPLVFVFLLGFVVEYFSKIWKGRDRIGAVIFVI